MRFGARTHLGSNTRPGLPARPRPSALSPQLGDLIRDTDSHRGRQAQGRTRERHVPAGLWGGGGQAGDGGWGGSGRGHSSCATNPADLRGQLTRLRGREGAKIVLQLGGKASPLSLLINIFICAARRSLTWPPSPEGKITRPGKHKDTISPGPSVLVTGAGTKVDCFQEEA